MNQLGWWVTMRDQGAEVEAGAPHAYQVADQMHTDVCERLALHVDDSGAGL